MTVFDIIYCLYVIRQFMSDVQYITLKYIVTRCNEKDRPHRK